MTAPFHRLAIAGFLALLAMRGAYAGDFFEVDGVALRGFDPVAYVESETPIRGVATHRAIHKGSTFLFASDANRRKFTAAPEKYAPQFGGYCALGTANGYKVPTQPDAFRVVDGKLYLNYDRRVLDIWKKDIPGNIARADANWPEVSKQPIRE
jgi:YHS domain-containing protein